MPPGACENACDNKPDLLNEPKSIMRIDGTVVQARGISISKNPIGEGEFVRGICENLPHE